MKAKVIILVALSLVVIFSSCGSKSGKRALQERSVVSKSDTLTFCPEKVGLTDLVIDFTPYPKFDGGAGISVSFFIGVQYKEKTYQIECSEAKFFSEKVTKEAAESNPAIERLFLIHNLVSNTPRGFIDATAIKGEVVKLTRRATFFPDGSFYPAKVIWAKR